MVNNFVWYNLLPIASALSFNISNKIAYISTFKDVRPQKGNLNISFKWFSKKCQNEFRSSKVFSIFSYAERRKNNWGFVQFAVTSPTGIIFLARSGVQKWWVKMQILDWRENIEWKLWGTNKSVINAQSCELLQQKGFTF